MAAAALARPLAWILYFMLILWAWSWLYSMAGGMGLDLFGTMRIVAGGAAMGSAGAGGMEAAAAMSTAAVLIPMWVVMMAAMMGPTFVPAARTYEDLIGTGAGSRAGFFGVIAGYLAVWFGYGVALGLAHAWFVDLALLDAMGQSRVRWFSAALLLAAGVYQFTGTKDRCLAHCRSPMMHFLAHWQAGPWGGAMMGARIGLWCIACCWAIMALGFVGGAMNLVWMGITTLIMTLEKLPDLGRWLTRPLGVLFVGAACAAALGLI